MKAYTIDPKQQLLKEVDVVLQADTAYSFFKSLLIDESLIIKDHVIYTDMNALNQKKKPFFLAEHLLIGDALILGRIGLEDTQATIPQEDLQSLIQYEVPQFYEEVLILIAPFSVNLYKMFLAKKDDEVVELNIEWVLYTFNIADEATKEYFIKELQKTIDANEDVTKYMEKMAQLALNAIQ